MARYHHRPASTPHPVAATVFSFPPPPPLQQYVDSAGASIYGVVDVLDPRHLSTAADVLNLALYIYRVDAVLPPSLLKTSEICGEELCRVPTEMCALASFDPQRESSVTLVPLECQMAYSFQTVTFLHTIC
jgi:hypothetical protein